MIRLFAALAGSRGLAAIILLVTNVLFARFAGPEIFGAASIVLSASTFAFVMIDSGVSTYIIRAAAREERGRVENAIRMNATTSALGAILIATTILILSSVGVVPGVLALLGAGLALEKSADALSGIFIARGAKRVLAEVIIVRRVFNLCLFVVLSVFGVEVLSSYAIAFLCGALVSWLRVRTQIASLGLKGASPVSWRAMIRECLPFLAANASASARNLDAPLIGMVSGGAAAGVWAAAQRLTTPFMLLPGALSSAVLPEAARSTSLRLRAASIKLSIVHAVLALVLVVPSMLSGEIVLLVLGPEFVDAGPVLRWLLLAFPFIALSSILGGVLQGAGEERFVARNGVVFAVLLVGWFGAGASLFSIGLVALGVAVVYVAKCFTLGLRLLRVGGQG